MWIEISENTLSAILKLVGWALATLVGAFAGSYLGSYMKTKGENKAIHEDINKLVDQVAAVTKASKEIEAKISGELWDRQKRWEMKKEVLFVAVKRIAELDDMLLKYGVTDARFKANPQDEEVRKSHAESVDTLQKALATFEETNALVAILCGPNTRDAIYKFWHLVLNIAAAIPSGKPISSDLQKEVIGRILTARAAIRGELGIQESKPQSSVSSATQGPAPPSPATKS